MGVLQPQFQAGQAIRSAQYAVDGRFSAPTYLIFPENASNMEFSASRTKQTVDFVIEMRSARGGERRVPLFYACTFGKLSIFSAIQTLTTACLLAASLSASRSRRSPSIRGSPR